MCTDLEILKTKNLFERLEKPALGNLKFLLIAANRKTSIMFTYFDNTKHN